MNGERVRCAGCGLITLGRPGEACRRCDGHYAIDAPPAAPEPVVSEPFPWGRVLMIIIGLAICAPIAGAIVRAATGGAAEDEPVQLRRVALPSGVSVEFPSTWSEAPRSQNESVPGVVEHMFYRDRESSAAVEVIRLERPPDQPPPPNEVMDRSLPNRGYNSYRGPDPEAFSIGPHRAYRREATAHNGEPLTCRQVMVDQGTHYIFVLAYSQTGEYARQERTLRAISESLRL